MLPLDIRGPLLEELVELPAPDYSHVQLRRESRSLEDRLEPVQGNQLPDEEEAERLVRPPGRAEQPLLRAHEADLDPRARDLADLREEVRVRLGVGDDEVGEPECAAVDRGENPCGKRAAPESAAVGDERVVERDERVEDERPLPGDSASAGNVEVTRVADEDGVEGIARVPAEARLGESQAKARPPARGPVVAPALPDRGVPLDHVDARGAQRRDHLGIPRIVALVRPEVEDAHGRV